MLSDRFRLRYEKFADGGVFGGSQILAEMAALARDETESTSGQEQVLAFCLASLFGDAADRLDGKAVDAFHAREWFRSVHPAVTAALSAAPAQLPMSIERLVSVYVLLAPHVR